MITPESINGLGGGSTTHKHEKIKMEMQKYFTSKISEKFAQNCIEGDVGPDHWFFVQAKENDDRFAPLQKIH